jgi:hypothetical protein
MHAEEVPAYQRQLEEQKDQKRNVAKYKEFCRKYELFDIMNKADEWTTKISENRVADLINSYFNNELPKN